MGKNKDNYSDTFRDQLSSLGIDPDKVEVYPNFKDNSENIEDIISFITTYKCKCNTT